MRALFLALAIIATCGISAQVSINTDGSNADPSAGLEVKFTNKGFLPPRLSTPSMHTISSPAEGLMVYNTDEKSMCFFNGTDWVDMIGTIVPDLVIGDTYVGGIIFYLDGSGGGMVCAVSDHSALTEWGCDGTPISGADGTAIGTGSQNTIDIEAGCTTPGIAADICANLSLNGYTDWFLPSKDELNAMYENKAAIDAAAIINGGVAFYTGSILYWSSSEYGSLRAGRQYFANGTQSDHPRNGNGRVRAVRAF